MNSEIDERPSLSLLIHQSNYLLSTMPEAPLPFGLSIADHLLPLDARVLYWLLVRSASDPVGVVCGKALSAAQSGGALAACLARPSESC